MGNSFFSVTGNNSIPFTSSRINKFCALLVVLALPIKALLSAYDYEQEVHFGFDSQDHFYQSRSWVVEIAGCLLALFVWLWTRYMLNQRQVSFRSQGVKCLYQVFYFLSLLIIVGMAGFRLIDLIEAHRYSQVVASIIDRDAPDCILGARSLEIILLFLILFPPLRRVMPCCTSCYGLFAEFNHKNIVDNQSSSLIKGHSLSTNSDIGEFTGMLASYSDMSTSTNSYVGESTGMFASHSDSSITNIW